ncbi:MAG TPA: hypothetical protein VMB34_19175 [Acetobacteraceae bacterium]|nr:hypothetical protein [Acetobacteraceae bacterium]
MPLPTDGMSTWDTPVPSQAEEAEELAISGLFDPLWYGTTYPDVAATDLEPVVHFVRHGWEEHRLPNPYFDPAWYLATNPDVVATGINPLLHYLRHGDLAGRRPMPYFDPAWYRAAHDLAPDRLALRHFLPRRSTGLFAPCAALYAVPLLPEYHARTARGEDPFRCYLDDISRTRQDVVPDARLLAASGLFDAGYYLLNGSDVQDAALDPLLHFCHYGWGEKRRPNRYFDTAWYLATNDRAARLGLNPLAHYLCEGEAAGRRPVPYFDPGWYRATYAVPLGQNALAHYLAHRHTQAFSPTPLFDVAWYVARHADEVGPHRDPFAHFLQASRHGNVDPSPQFDAADYRRWHLQPSQSASHGTQPFGEIDNPLVHHLQSAYR